MSTTNGTSQKKPFNSAEYWMRATRVLVAVMNEFLHILIKQLP